MSTDEGQPALGSSAVVIRDLLVRAAAEAAERELVRFEDGSSWSRARALEEAYRGAAALRAVGVGQDGRVGLFLANGPDFLRAWWGANALGACVVPINLAYRKEMLLHALALTSPDVVVAGDAQAARLDQVGLPVQCLLARDLAATDAACVDSAPAIDRAGVHSLAFTSGTTGPSKASITSHLHLYRTGSFTFAAGLGLDDVFLIDLPLFHNAAQSMIVASLAAGARIALRTVPAMNDYWTVANQTGATAAVLVGSMVSYLLAQPPRDTDRRHALRWILAAPAPPQANRFMERFRIRELLTCYGSTELSGPLVRVPGTPLVAGSAGRLRPGYHVRLLDEAGREVRPGYVGELVARAEERAALSLGYFGDQEATDRAWRDGWFHTGDVLRCDEKGNYFFHDRAKDALRRRGENISSFEVEREVLAFPGVSEVACVAGPGEFAGDDEVKVFIVPAPGRMLDFGAMVGFLAERMPHFMVPRYFELIDVLPRTETQRVRKHELRAAGNSERTWDRESHGLRVTRDGLRSRADA